MNIVMFAISLSFTKHSSFFYFPRTFSPLLAVYLSLFSYIAPSHSRLFLLCIFQSLLWAWLYFLLLSFWNVLRAVCSSLPFLACFIFVWHRHSHTQKVCSNQMGGMRFLKKMFSYKRISFLVFFFTGNPSCAQLSWCRNWALQNDFLEKEISINCFHKKMEKE